MPQGSTPRQTFFSPCSYDPVSSPTSYPLSRDRMTVCVNEKGFRMFLTQRESGFIRVISFARPYGEIVPVKGIPLGALVALIRRSEL